MRDRLESLLAAWGHFSFRHPWAVIGAVLLVAAPLIAQLPRLTFDTSMEGFFHEKDPVRVSYDAFRKRFGRDTFIILAVRPPAGVFDLAFLQKLKALHEDIEREVPQLKEVTSLINARDTRGVGDELVVGELMEDWPESAEEVALIEKRALANPLYVNNLISADGRLTTIVIETEAYSSLGVAREELGGFEETEPVADTEEPPFLTGEENAAIVQALYRVIERHRAPDIEIYAAGSPVMVDQIQVAMQRDMRVFTGLAVLTIAGFLALLFRRAAAVVLPLVTVILSVLATLSVMAVSGTPLMSPTQILPSFLLAVGVGASVHILAIFYQARGRGDSEEDAISYALGHSGLAVLMTSLTTAGGLFSFVVAEMRPISHLGIFGPVGVLMAMAFTILLLPALICVFPGSRAVSRQPTRWAFSQQVLIRAGDLAVRRSGLVVAVWAIVIVIAGFGAARVRFSHKPTEWFPKGHDVRTAMELVNDEMHGSMSVELLIESGEENGLQAPSLLQNMDALARYAETLEIGDLSVGKALSLADVVEETHQALNEDRPEYHVIPDDRLLVAQELLLFENGGSDDLEDFVDPQFSLGRMTLRVPMKDSVGLPPLYDAITAAAERILGEQTRFELTGMGVVIGRTIPAAMSTMTRSYIIAFAIITPLMILLLGSVRTGLLSMIPNLAPILVTLGLMGWLGIPLDVFTLMVGSIAIGLAVDDTIHFLHNFRRYHLRSGNVREAVRETLSTTGQALLFTSLVLSTGFFLYMAATMDILFYFGLLTGFTIIVAFLADLLLAPALLALLYGAREAKRGEALEMEVSG